MAKGRKWGFVELLCNEHAEPHIIPLSLCSLETATFSFGEKIGSSQRRGLYSWFHGETECLQLEQ